MNFQKKFTGYEGILHRAIEASLPAVQHQDISIDEMLSFQLPYAVAHQYNTIIMGNFADSALAYSETPSLQSIRSVLRRFHKIFKD